MTVEGRQEAVACAVYLTAAIPQQLAAHERVVPFQQFAPAPISELDRLRGRIDDVSEEDGRKHALGFGLLPPAGLPDLFQEAFDLDLDSIG